MPSAGFVPRTASPPLANAPMAAIRRLSLAVRLPSPGPVVRVTEGDEQKFIGMAEIADDGRVSLNVRPTISRVLRFRNDPNPSLCDTNRTNCVPSQVPEVQVREMESVLQISSGQTVILGGLMQDDVRLNREQLPGADLIEQRRRYLRCHARNQEYHNRNK